MLLELFLEFFLIGALSFGGGYGTLALIEDAAIIRHNWLSKEQLTDLFTIAEITPGPIALNAASFTGHITAGIPGAAAATLGCILPSCVITAVLAAIYSSYADHPIFRNAVSGIRIAVCAMIFSAFLTLFGSFASFSLSRLPHMLLFAGALLLAYTKKLPPSLIILLSGVIGVLIGLIT